MYTIFETFVGAGGSHIGFTKKGFTSVYVNDNVQECLDTLILNNPKLKDTAYIDDRSILDVDRETILKKIGLKKKELDVMFGGIVCKGFSLAGERSPNDERNYFYHKQIELTNEIKPKISIIENVKGILNAKVLSRNTPSKIKKQIDSVWQDLENYKGQKADLRKKNKVTKEVEEKGEELRKKKKKLLGYITQKRYLISVMDDIVDTFDKSGYRTKFRVLNTAWYGAATKRERVIIVAVRKDIDIDFKFPIPKFHNSSISTRFTGKDLSKLKLKKPVTVGDALAKIDYKKKDIDNEPMNHLKKTVARFKYIPEGDNVSNHIDKLPDDLKISSFYSRGNTMRLDRNKPSPTLVPGHSNFPIHPYEHRSITVREAATITGFPINYKFVGNHTKRCEHVGNAVPPPLAEAIAESCIELLKKVKQ